jgi:hypothetical protein
MACFEASQFSRRVSRPLRRRNLVALDQPLRLEGDRQLQLDGGEIVLSRARLPRPQKCIHSLLPVRFLLVSLRQRQDEFTHVVKRDKATVIFEDNRGLKVAAPSHASPTPELRRKVRSGVANAVEKIDEAWTYATIGAPL